MKRFVCLVFVSWLSVSAISQTSLCITTDKTTSLVFPYKIRHVDRGSKSILAEQVKESPNILLVKAATNDFPETNLSVITDDGSVYTFTVDYEASPLLWVYHLPPNVKASISSYANAILDNRQNTSGLKDKKSGVMAQIKGIYIQGDVLYFQLYLMNISALNYDIDLLRFYIRDKKKNKRTAIQENDLQPLYIAGDTSTVKAKNSTTIVVALDKFTIPDAKYLAVEIMEKNGGRHLLLKVRNKKIMQAATLPDLR